MNNYMAFFNHDLQTKNIWVKRVIGRPGDTLAFHDGKVWRNGQPLDEPYINEPMEYSRKGEIKIPEAMSSAWVITATTAVTAASSARSPSTTS